MASVYSNAYCTIAASSSSNGSEGCHINHDLAPYGPVTLTCVKTDDLGNSVPEQVRVFSQFGMPTQNILQTDPLTKRGWTLQERKLSPRMLHYSKDTVRWECMTLKASMLFPWNDNLAFNGAVRRFDVGQIGNAGGKGLMDEKQRAKNQEAWFATVHNFTGRAFTKQSDILPASSGIASLVQQFTGDRYLAGLWESYLVKCLMWASAWHVDLGYGTHSRPSEYLAPSWSWASICGQVKYEYCVDNALDLSPDSRLLPTILEASTTTTGPDEFGQVMGGYVHLSGKFKMAVPHGKGYAPRSARQDCEGLYELQSGGAKVGDIRHDIPSDVVENKLSYVNCSCLHPREKRFCDVIGLALVPTGEKEMYRRVGLVFAIESSWFEAALTSAITII
jgi:hypothetical protein